MLNFLLQNKRLRDQSGSNRVLISALTRFADSSQPFRVLAMLAALAFFIFLVLIPIAQAQTGAKARSAAFSFFVYSPVFLAYTRRTQNVYRPIFFASTGNDPSQVFLPLAFCNSKNKRR